MLGYNALKPKDLSHLVDSRIGNPDYDPTDIIVNGGFDTDSDWQKAGTAAIASGVGTLTGDGTTNNYLQQQVLTVGKSYLVTYTVTENTLVGGTANSRIYCPNLTSYYFKDSVGTHYIQFTALATGFYFRTLTTITGGSISFDNVSITEWSGEELVPDPDVGFVANDVSKWILGGSNTAEQDENAVKITYVDDDGAAVYLRKTTSETTFRDFVVGDKIRVDVLIKTNGNSDMYIDIYDGATYQVLADPITVTEFTRYSGDVTIAGTGAIHFRVKDLSSGDILWCEFKSVMKNSE